MGVTKTIEIKSLLVVIFVYIHVQVQVHVEKLGYWPNS